MYTYGYIVDAALAKLDMNRKNAELYGLIDKIPYYANEAMTQICSAVKPKRTFAEFVVASTTFIKNRLKLDKPGIKLDFLELPWEAIRDGYDEWHQQCWKEYHSITSLGAITKMPNDFISFGDEENKKIIINENDERETVTASDDDYIIRGSNSILFYYSGIYYISYNAKWCVFDKNTDFDFEIDAPDDVIQCIPSYVVSQLFKVDDETKAQLYRNEYEQFLARIDDDHYVNGKSIHITGDW